MPKPHHKVVIMGDQLPDLDVLAIARVIVRFARERQARQSRRPEQDMPAATDKGAA